MNYRIATVDELQDIAYREETHLRPVRHHLGIAAFGTNAWTAANVGDRLMPEHREDDGIEELYVVLRGRARFEVDGETVDAPQGTLVFVRPAGNRTAFAEEAGTTVLAIGSKIGEAYEVGGWEVWAEFQPAYEAGEYDAVIARARARRWRRAVTQRRSTTSRAARPLQAAATTRSTTSGSRSNNGRACASSLRATPTSIRCETSPRFSSSPGVPDHAQTTPALPEWRGMTPEHAPYSPDRRRRVSAWG